MTNVRFYALRECRVTVNGTSNVLVINSLNQRYPGMYEMQSPENMTKSPENMTKFGRKSFNNRSHASPELDRTRCPKE